MSKELFSMEAETATLSILVKNPEKVFDINSLKPQMFSSGVNQFLFDIILKLQNQGLVPNVNLLEPYLDSINKLDESGSRDYLEYLLNQNFDENNFDEYCNIVERSYKARNLIRISSGIPNAVNTTTNIDSVILQLRNSLDSLTSDFGGKGAIDLGDILPAVWNQIDKKVKNPGISGFDSGFSGINLTTGGYHSGNLWIIASRPGMGKTAFLCNSTLETAKAGVRSLVFQHEMGKQEMVERYIGIECGIPIINLKMGRLNQKDLNSISEVMKVFKELPIIIDTSFGSDIEYLKSTVKRLHKTKGIDLVFVDYLQLMVPRTNNMLHDLGTVSRELKLLATQLDIGVIGLCQLNRGVEHRDDKRPMLADLRQSGNLEEDADLVAMLYRDYVYNTSTKNKDRMEFIIRKHRSGPLGIIPLAFDAESNKITEE